MFVTKGVYCAFLAEKLVCCCREELTATNQKPVPCDYIVEETPSRVHVADQVHSGFLQFDGIVVIPGMSVSANLIYFDEE